MYSRDHKNNRKIKFTWDKKSLKYKQYFKPYFPKNTNSFPYILYRIVCSANVTTAFLSYLDSLTWVNIDYSFQCQSANISCRLFLRENLSHPSLHVSLCSSNYFRHPLGFTEIFFSFSFLNPPAKQYDSKILHYSCHFPCSNTSNRTLLPRIKPQIIYGGIFNNLTIIPSVMCNPSFLPSSLPFFF